MKELGYQESSTTFDYDDAAASEYGNTYIITCRSGALDEFRGETIKDRIYDNQQWDIQIAIETSSLSDLSNLDEIHRKREAIVKKVDNSNNWIGFARILKFKGWGIEERQSYFIIRISLNIMDTIIF
jgi:hypothetical protein